MNILPIAIENAKSQIHKVLNNINQQYGLPPCIIDGILSAVLAEVRAEAKIELVEVTNEMSKMEGDDKEVNEEPDN